MVAAASQKRQSDKQASQARGLFYVGGCFVETFL